jgi:type 1 glutamine amidotransferase
VPDPTNPRPRVAVFTRTSEYRHDSIPEGVNCLRQLGAAQGFDVVATEDPDLLADELNDVAAVVFLSTSGEVLTPRAREALRSHVAGGGGFVGVHAAACTEYDWPYYGDLLGARFDHHPALQPGVVRVEDRDHPATAHLAADWPFTDEWYVFRSDPRPQVRVLAVGGPHPLPGGDPGGRDNSGSTDSTGPLVWCHENLGGRVFYTALGHSPAAFADPSFRSHLLGGLRYALRSAE